MSQQPLNILISGAGVAGASLALMLARQPGFKVRPKITLIEKAPEPRTTGQAVDIRGPGVDVICKLGLEPEIKAGVATVFVDRPAGRIDADAVLSDSFGGARSGTAHLVAHGHRRIGFIGDQPRIHTAVERLRGYRAAMADADLSVEDSWVSLGTTVPERVHEAVVTMLGAPEPVTAIFTGNNRVTVTVVRALAAHDRPVALVGFDDIELADLLDPGVTVVAQDAATLGRTAAERLFRRLDGAADAPSQVVLPTRLIARGSGELPPPSGR